ncbi:MalM family protein [Vibrio sp. PNB22_4_1]
MKNGLMILLSSLGLFGCVSSDGNNLKQVNLQLDRPQLCCENVSQFPWVLLQTEEDLNFDLDESSPVWQFDSGRSYFSAFEFSERSGSVGILLRSNMLNGKVIEPKVALYNLNFKLVKILEEKDFEIKFSDALARNRYELTFKVDSAMTPYMVLYADASDFGEKVTVPHPARIRAEEGGEPAPMVADPVYYKSPTGSFNLELETLTLSSYKKKMNKVPVDSVASPHQVKTINKSVISDTRKYYFNVITKSVEEGDIPKALSLLDEAKALGIEGAQEVFVKAVNSK